MDKSKKSNLLIIVGVLILILVTVFSYYFRKYQQTTSENINKNISNEETHIFKGTVVKFEDSSFFVTGTPDEQVKLGSGEDVYWSQYVEIKFDENTRFYKVLPVTSINEMFSATTTKPNTQDINFDEFKSKVSNSRLVISILSAEDFKDKESVYAKEVSFVEFNIN